MTLNEGTDASHRVAAAQTYANQRAMQEIRTEFEELKEKRMDSLEAQHKLLLDQVHELYAEQHKFRRRFDAVDSRFEEVDARHVHHAEFQLSTQPLITHLQISDMLQEFLCVPDQLKLIEVDR